MHVRGLKWHITDVEEYIERKKDKENIDLCVFLRPFIFSNLFIDKAFDNDFLVHLASLAMAGEAPTVAGFSIHQEIKKADK